MSEFSLSEQYRNGSHSLKASFSTVYNRYAKMAESLLNVAEKIVDGPDALDDGILGLIKITEAIDEVLEGKYGITTEDEYKGAVIGVLTNIAHIAVCDTCRKHRDRTI